MTGIIDDIQITDDRLLINLDVQTIISRLLMAIMKYFQSVNQSSLICMYSNTDGSIVLLIMNN